MKKTEAKAKLKTAFSLYRIVRATAHPQPADAATIRETVTDPGIGGTRGY